jgi:hypothetical protein
MNDFDAFLASWSLWSFGTSRRFWLCHYLKKNQRSFLQLGLSLDRKFSVSEKNLKKLLNASSSSFLPFRHC